MKQEMHYGGNSWRLFGSQWLTIWILDYRKNTVVKDCRFAVDVYSKLWGNKRIISI